MTAPAPPRPPATAPATAPVQYAVDAAARAGHRFAVTLAIAAPAALQRVSLPVWIPGSYLVREFARHLQGLAAEQAGMPVAVLQRDKSTWEIACAAGIPLVLRYEVYAFDPSVRACWLGSERGFFNATGLLLRVHGQEDAPHTLDIAARGLPADWRCATALLPAAPAGIDARGFGRYAAAGYDELADSPVELGAFWSGDFTAGGVAHRFVVAGAAPTFDGARLLADTQRICAAQIAFWHPDGAAPAHGRYVFLLNAVDEGYGGLEHRHSTALICNRRDLPRSGAEKPTEGYTTLLGLISHEYFHTWNVKRLRPAEFARYDYTQENYTRLLWFFEGFTSYYDDLLLRRAGLIDDATYLKLLAKTANQVAQTPGRAVQSAAAASFDAWVKYYRPDENTANATVSYYTKGALIALAFDLTLRREGAAGNLDHVMRALWQRCAAGPMSQDDFAAALQAASGRAWPREIADWVHGTGELPLEELLAAHGVAVRHEPAQPAQRLGLRVAESGGTLTLKTVLRGGAAEQAGMAAGDEWLAVAGPDGVPWRIGKLDDLALYLGDASACTAWVARDRRVLQLALVLPAGATTLRLAVADPAALQRWLQGPKSNAGDAGDATGAAAGNAAGAAASDAAT